MPSSTDRIPILKAELAALKRERKEQAIAAKKEQQWVSVKKRLPENEDQRVIVWREDHIELCWFSKGKWYTYNGSFFLEGKDVIEGVSHWLGTDWMHSKYSPSYGPGIKNFLLYHWYNLTDKASDVAYDLRPKSWSKGNAQLSQKPTFYQDRSGKVVTGLPEDRPAPRGFQKIVCNNVFEAEKLSELQRRQERIEHGKIKEDREQIEGAAQKAWRSNAHNLMANARNQVNRDFMEAALARNAEHRPWEYSRESYLHSEGHEEGH